MTLMLPAPKFAGLLPAKSSHLLQVFSFGGGVQSMAVMALQATQGLFDYDAFVFANVGDDSENPATLAYIERYVKPFVAAYGLRFVQVQHTLGKKPITLYEYAMRDGRSIPLPMYMSGGAPGNRSCTQNFKIEVVDKWARTDKPTHVIIGLGISWDESERMRPVKWIKEQRKNRPLPFWKRNNYPLIDLRINRSDCEAIITSAGLPVPPKSSCYFCPFHSRNTWIELKRSEPELFERSVALELRQNDKRRSRPSDRLYLHRDLVPLEQAVGNQAPLFPDETDTCETGYCNT